MDRMLFFGMQPLTAAIGKYRFVKNGHIVTLQTSKGTPVGRITLSPSGEQRGALWLKDSLVGEFEYSQKSWHVYAIENGRISRTAWKGDPIEYMIHRLEGSPYRPPNTLTRNGASRLAHVG